MEIIYKLFWLQNEYFKKNYTKWIVENADKTRYIKYKDGKEFTDLLSEKIIEKANLEIR